MDRQIIEYLPEFMREFKEIKIICEQEQGQIENLWRQIDIIWENQFIDTADEYTLGRWENALSLTALDSDSLEDRRFRIMSALNNQLIYTNLEHYLKLIVGENKYSIDFIPNELTLKIRIALSRRSQYSTVLKLIKKIIPCNLLLDYSLKYNRNSYYSTWKHSEMAQYTHKQLKENIWEEL